MQANFSNFLVKLDKVCDYIPVVSTLRNITDLFQTVLVLPFLNDDFRFTNNYYRHLEFKDCFRSIILLIPLIGNVIIAIYDFSNRGQYNSRDWFRSELYNYHPVYNPNYNPNYNTDYNPFDNSSIFLHASIEIKNDRDFILEMVPRNFNLLRFVSDELKRDKNFALELVRIDGCLVDYVSDELKNDIDVAAAAVSRFGYAINSIGKDLLASRESLVKLVALARQMPINSRDKLLQDRAFLLDVIEKNEGILREIPHETQDVAFEVDAVSRNYRAIQFAYPYADFKTVEGLVLDAVKRHPEVLSYTYSLRRDPAFILEVVKRNPLALEYAVSNLFAERDFMLDVIEIYAGAFDHIDLVLKDEDAFIVGAAQRNGLVLEFIPETKKTIEVVFAATKQNPAANQFVPAGLISRERILADIQAHPALLPLVPVDEITPEMAIAAVEVNPLLLQFVPAEILITAAGDNIIRTALERNSEALEFVFPEFLSQTIVESVICRYIADDEVDLIAARYKAAKKLVDRVYSREIVISVAQEWALPLAQLLKSDAKFILYVIMNHGVRLADLIEESRDNEEVVYTVVSQDPDEINGASERLRADPVLIQYAADVRASLSQSLQA